ncbi:hypothetical protein GGS21DRAFT_490998 [Xylaria nigripes]|nr:hypothetical protein GGS21DRAFT_490998 [Xylaria nigripes]
MRSSSAPPEEILSSPTIPASPIYAPPSSPSGSDSGSVPIDPELSAPRPNYNDFRWVDRIAFQTHRPLNPRDCHHCTAAAHHTNLVCIEALDHTIGVLGTIVINGVDCRTDQFVSRVTGADITGVISFETTRQSVPPGDWWEWERRRIAPAIGAAFWPPSPEAAISDQYHVDSDLWHFRSSGLARRLGVDRPVGFAARREFCRYVTWVRRSEWSRRHGIQPPAAPPVPASIRRLAETRASYRRPVVQVENNPPFVFPTRYQEFSARHREPWATDMDGGTSDTFGEDTDANVFIDNFVTPHGRENTRP